MSTPNDILKPEDVEFYERELKSFIPDRVVDAHCHPWRSGLGQANDLAEEVDAQTFLDYMAAIMPNRKIRALFLPLWRHRDLSSLGPANEWNSEQTKTSGNRGLFVISPTDDPEWVRQEVRRLGLHGLKCYHTFANTDPTWEAEIPDYLPEPLIKVADEEGWFITLHMVKQRAVADPGNLHWIRHYCLNYPNIKLILAHSARGFQPAHNLEGLPALADLDNVYFDSSGNCEPIAHQSIIRIMGHKRLMYGSDFWVSHNRGRSLAAADTFIWLYGDSPEWGEKHLAIKPVMIGLEHLRSMKWACWSEGLSDSQVEDIFWNNAAELLGMK
jgi:glutamate-1-semialdehyde 2,1-aminomutase